jgi:hypothetical protein
MFTRIINASMAEIAAALSDLIWVGRRCHSATAFTLETDSAVAYYTLGTGKGLSIHTSQMLQT